MLRIRPSTSSTRANSNSAARLRSEVASTNSFAITLASVVEGMKSEAEISGRLPTPIATPPQPEDPRADHPRDAEWQHRHPHHLPLGRAQRERRLALRLRHHPE